MHDLLIYSLKAAFVLALLYVPYTLLLRKENFFRLNQLMLLLILTLSLLLPLCNISSLAISQPATQMVEMQKENLETLFVMHSSDAADSSQVQQTVGEAATADTFNFDTAIRWIAFLHLAGIAIMLLFRLWQFISMERHIRRGALWSSKEGGATIYCHATDVKPCSWMNSIVISQQDYQNNKHEILLHEKGHILHRHSLDILLLTLVQLTQWWNPFIYMLGTSLRDVHEYEADHYVLSQGVSVHEYQSLLLKTAVGSSSYAFTNSFNHSLTKKRITMMKEQKTSPWMRCKSLYILPLSLVAICAFATPEETAILTEMTSPEKVVAATPAPVPAPTMNEPEPAPVPAPTVADSKPAPAATPQPASEPDLFPKVKDLDDVLLVWNGKPVTSKELKSLIKESATTPTAVVLNPNLKEKLRRLAPMKLIWFAENKQEQGIAFLKQLYNSEKAKNGAIIATSKDLGDTSAPFDEFFQKIVGIQPTSTQVVEFTHCKPLNVDVESGTFTIDGTVSPGLRDVAYLIHIADQDGDIVDKPTAVILVKDGKFSYNTHLEKPTKIRIRAIFEDGSICPDWIENIFYPRTTASITVSNGAYNMNTRPNN